MKLILTKKYKSLILIFLFASFTSFSQTTTYTNDWIDTSKIYVKLTVEKKGFYTASISEMAQVDPSLIGAKAENLNLFFRGKSIAFEVISTGPTLTANDRIVFFGNKNDGKLETEMYRPATAQPHIFSSLFSKESHYFLVNDPQNPLKNRIKIEAEALLANAKTIVSQVYENQKVFESEYSFNSTVGPIPVIQQSFFENGEAYTGEQLRAGKNYEYPITVNDAISGKGVLELILNGRSDDIRRVRIRVANKDTTVVLAQFNFRNFKIPISFIGNSIKLILSSADDRYSLSLYKLSYDNKITLKNNESSIFVPSNTAGTLKISDELNGFQPTVYNVTDPFEVKKLKFTGKESNSLNYLVSTKGGTSANEYFYSENFLKPSISKFNPTTLETYDEANYLIISHKNLEASAKKYKEFRESELGGANQVELVFMDDIYNHFNYGIKSPQAIRNFLNLKLNQGSPKNLLLLGKAFSAHTGTNGPEDLVPSWGYPASDLLLSAGLVTKADVYGIATGRIPALTDKEVISYLDKLKRNIVLPVDVKRKNMVHFSGGKTVQEIGHFGNIMDSLANFATKSDFNINLESNRKPKAGEIEPFNFSPKVNNGLSLISFFGHSSYTTLDYDPGFATNPELGYNNLRCPVLFINGCAYNNYFRERKTQSWDWILAENKGAIGIIGQSYYGYESALNKHGQKLYETIFYSDEEPTVGEALRITAEKIANLPNFSQLDVLNNCQTLLFGDPTVKIFGFDKPDLEIDSSTFKSQVTGTNRNVSFTLLNTGKKILKDKISIKIIQEGLPENIEKVFTVTAPKISEVVNLNLPSINVLSKLRVQIDNDNFVIEANENNNIYDLIEGGPKKLNPDKSGPFIVAKLDNRDPFEMMIVSSKPSLQLLVKDNTPLIKKGKNNTTIYAFTKTCDDCDYTKLDFSKMTSKVSVSDSSTLIYDISLGEYKPGEYFLLFYAADSANNINFDNPVKLSFQIVESGSPTLEYVMFPNPTGKCVTFRINDFSSYAKGTLAVYLSTLKGSKVADFVKPINAGKTNVDYCFDTPGVYVYRVKLDVGDKPKTFTGKILVID